MPQFRARRRRPSFRLVAVSATVALLLGLSLVGVAYAQDYRGRDGDSGRSAHRHPTSFVPIGGDQVGRGSADRGQAGRDQVRRDQTDRDQTDRDRADPGQPDPGQPDPTDSQQIEPLDPNVKLQPPDPPDSLVPGTPCTKTTHACVSLGQKRSWLFKKDPDSGETVIDHGPVPVNIGGPGKETPLGDFKVEWKDKNHKSSEYFVPHGCVEGSPGCEGAPMNWAVFFAEGGIAFHEGTLAIRSSGCVRLSAKDAEFYYTSLQIGDKVEIRN